MRLSAKTYTILDVPVSRGEFWLLATFCVAGSLALLFAARPALGLLVRVMGGAG